MRQQLLHDLLAYLKATPESDERDRLIEELQVIGASLVYKPQTKYRLERNYTALNVVYVEGKIETVPTPTRMNVACTPHSHKMKKQVEEAIKEYPLEELRLYHGSKRIKDIERWLKEAE